MLLEVDGRDVMWQDGVSPDDLSTDCYAIYRLQNLDNEEMRIVTNNAAFDYSDFPLLNEVRDVRSLTFDEIRAKLVDHFDIRFHEGGIVWPRRVERPRSV